MHTPVLRSLEFSGPASDFRCVETGQNQGLQSSSDTACGVSGDLGRMPQRPPTARRVHRGLAFHELLATTNGSDENSVTRRLLVPVLSKGKGVHRLVLYTRHI